MYGNTRAIGDKRGEVNSFWQFLYLFWQFQSRILMTPQREAFTDEDDEDAYVFLSFYTRAPKATRATEGGPMRKWSGSNDLHGLKALLPLP